MNPRKAHTENPEGITANEIFSALESAPKVHVHNPFLWNTQLKAERGLYRHNSYNRQNYQMQSGFYPRVMPVVSKSQLTEIIESLGFSKSAVYEGFELTLHDKYFGISGQYDMDLNLCCAYCLPLYWMVVDVKKQYNEGNECDVRFEISTKQKCAAETMRKLVNPLFWQVESDSAFPFVKPSILKQAESLRYINLNKNIFYLMNLM